MTDCSNCDGTGWISGKDDAGLAVATRCDCVPQKEQERHVVQAEVPKKFVRCRIDNLLLPPPDNPMRQPMNEIVGWLRMFIRDYPYGNSKKGVLLCGSHGIGKTHLAVGVLQALVEKGFEGRFVNYQAFLDKIRASYDKTLGSVSGDVYKEAMETEILLLDDLGANRVSDWVEDTICGVISHRYGEEKTVIVTTNFPMSGPNFPATLADRIGERSASRLQEMCQCFQMPALDDFRAKGKL